MNPWRAVVEAAFPASCPGCGRPAEPVCDACARALRAPPALPPPAGVDRWVALFAYEGVARELVARVKYWRTRATVPWLAARMARLVAAAGADGALDVVTWTPTTSSRRHARGFDHAEVLARAVARELGLRARPMLRRRPSPRRPEVPPPPVVPGRASTPVTACSRLERCSSTTSPPPAQPSLPRPTRSGAPG